MYEKPYKFLTIGHYPEKISGKVKNFHSDIIQKMTRLHLELPDRLSA